MPNLFFNRKIGRVFDLKGSMRNRYEHKANSVGLDQNFLEFTRGFPLPLRESSKEHLKVCVHNDTLFLTNAQVIDYSLLVGFDEQSNELVVGIIDYIRLYTWDKQIETGVKLLTLDQHAPTIINPENYKLRFRKAMDRYFMVVPDRNSLLPEKEHATIETSRSSDDKDKKRGGLV
jgi:1-phosphatidylinositol-3-phosphate 5-kinase